MDENERQRKKYAEDAEYRKKKIKYAAAYREANRAKVNAQLRHRYATDSEYRAKESARGAKLRRAKILRQHGMSMQDYEAMLARQNGACGICERPFGPRRTPCIDHCHVTELVRGLLCSNCNVGLGFFDDSPIFARKASAYLTRWQQHLLELQLAQGNGMIAIASPEQREGAAQVRATLLNELRRPFGVEPPPPADWLQAISRGLVLQAAQRDVAAIKEVFDRIAGGTSLAMDSSDMLERLSAAWRDRLAQMKASTAQPSIAPAPAAAFQSHARTEFESKDRSACDRETSNIVAKRGAEPRRINTEHDHEH
jgi:Autographiviridae endonuclease VII